MLPFIKRYDTIVNHSTLTTTIAKVENVPNACTNIPIWNLVYCVLRNCIDASVVSCEAQPDDSELIHVSDSTFAEKWQLYCIEKNHKDELKHLNHKSDLHTYGMYYGTVPIEYMSATIYFIRKILESNAVRELEQKRAR